MAGNVKPVPFDGNCDSDYNPLQAPTSGALVPIWEMLPPNVCVPAGNAYILGASSPCGESKLGFCKGMVLLVPDTVYAPKGAQCSATEQAISALWVPTDVAGSYLVKELDGKIAVAPALTISVIATIPLISNIVTITVT